ncbi:hypothetical protein [Sorangium sp. So ce542]|uniref:hypothetical protein n=1 Tax=Sorangium sp. So ce542 TaxID=3133316 RepID=UPI003F62B87A
MHKASDAPGSRIIQAAAWPRARAWRHPPGPQLRPEAHKSCSSGHIGATFQRMIIIAVSLTVALVAADLLELGSRRRDRV